MVDKEHLVVELVKTKPFLHANLGTKNLPSTNTSFFQVDDPISHRSIQRKTLISISLKE